jgi:gas vesicle protein
MMTVAHRDTVNALSENRQDQTPGLEGASALPSPEKAETYTRQLFNIASDVQSELARWTQEQIGAQQETMRTWADQVGKASTSVARAAEQYSGTVQQAGQQGSEQMSDMAERGGQETSAMADAMSRSARRVGEQVSNSSPGSTASKH